MVLEAAHLLTMTKPSSGIHPIIIGKHCLNSQIMLYGFNFVKHLQHTFSHTNLELQLRVNVKQ
jgi:hypothetical protein